MTLPTEFANIRRRPGPRGEAPILLKRSGLNSRFAAPLVCLAGAIVAATAAIVFAAAEALSAAQVIPVLGLIAMLFAGAAFVTNRRLQRLQALIRHARNVAGGDLATRLAVASDDDIDALASVLNQLQKRIQASSSGDDLDPVLGAMSDAIFLTNEEGVIEKANASAAELLGCSVADLPGTVIRNYVAADVQDSFSIASEHQPLETVLVTADRHEIPVSYTSSKLDDAQSVFTGYVIAARNISERKMAEQRIRYLARIDALTKIPNRMQFQHLLQRAIARARRDNQQIALFYVDVDRFKDINDTYGHAAGDTCLEAVAARLNKSLPDGGIIGRLAGDEFGVALRLDEPAEIQPAHLQSIARHILNNLGATLIVQGHEIHLSASIGIAAYPKDADNVLDLTRSADAALYYTKRRGGNGFEFFDAAMNAANVERLMLKSKLRRSYELDELLMLYQPIIDLRTGNVAGAEALVRWELSERGIVLPSEFIPLAEETNLIIEIGEWVLNQVCRDIAEWRETEPETGTVAVNLSLKQLAQPRFTTRFREALERYRIPPDSLELEITETTLMGDMQNAVKILDELHAIGVSISIDDFGTGYSSLSALQKFPISTLKIDKSFVKDIPDDSDDSTIVSTIIEMAHSMEMQVIAEGVESRAQLDFLRRRKCDLVQGLLCGSPMVAEEYLEFLTMRKKEERPSGSSFG